MDQLNRPEPLRPDLRPYLLFSAASGFLWAWIAWTLGGSAFGPHIWAGVLVAPLLGLLAGRIYLPALGRPPLVRVLLALFTLYLTAALFGLAVGIADGYSARPGTAGTTTRIPEAVALETVLWTLWGLTFTGFVVVLWPLSYANHWLVARLARRPA